MRHWTPQLVADAASASMVISSPGQAGPERVTIDSRQAGPGALFVGLRGTSQDGGAYAAQALADGAWGTLTTTEYAESAARSANHQAVLAAPDPLRALQNLAMAWRRELKAQVIGVTGSTGKTSTKDLLNAILTPQRRTVASRANFNTEIGLPLEILAAPPDTQVMVLEMAMRGSGQIAELAAIAEPEVGVIVSIGPVHLELLKTVEAIAAAKAELIAGLAPGSSAIVPEGETLLTPHLRPDIRTVTFGAGGDVHLVSQDDDRVVIDAEGQRIELEVPFQQAHLRTDLLAAVAAARAVGVTPEGSVELTLTAGRGQSIALADGITLIDGCYNANPVSMRAALRDLEATAQRTHATRRVAVLGDMLELGPEGRAYHLELGELADEVGVDLLVTVGSLGAAIAERFEGEAVSVADAGEAAAIVPELLETGDVVLVKGSLGVGLRLVCDALSVGSVR
jgi:UDP-N-acetylmuramoyl-tripeptide--D-alanyl-D-alanine ligase